MLRKLVAAALIAVATGPAHAETKLLNASYDVSRELFVALNPLFQKEWQAKSGDTLVIDQSHAGSSNSRGADRVRSRNGTGASQRSGYEKAY